MKSFADNLDIIGRSQRTVKEAFIRLEAVAKGIGLTMNEHKTKYIEITNLLSNNNSLYVNEYTLESVEQLKYLGTLITRKKKVLN